ncbi:uncharacterized protein BJ171DRAFT_492349 [Polychytrium aggregatum]|uniref:uncharacterized protein n=1 Tax=Polychytrium aggregatum TaxID=110093 RepID=UPI0022FF2352|nr:uncharacterized protein BJ171DRAFT_492349 [Polychytrium aggregatum]KAI9208009.1 hypothetical protein BJ171DRAFT_492349 [Polychytrium aggregatum]
MSKRPIVDYSSSESDEDCPADAAAAKHDTPHPSALSVAASPASDSKRIRIDASCGISADDEAHGAEPAAAEPSDSSCPVDHIACSPGSSEHQGRIRSVPHIEGNWATHVFISVTPTDDLQLDIDAINTHASNRCGQAYHQFELPLHISLSRAVYLKVFQIPQFARLLGQSMNRHPRFKVGFNGISHYQNDDKTRSFLALDVGVGKYELGLLTQDVDAALRQFQQPVFYEPPRFHASIGWSLGSEPSAVSPALATSLRSWSRTLCRCSFVVGQIECTIGNKSFRWRLQHA